MEKSNFDQLIEETEASLVHLGQVAANLEVICKKYRENVILVAERMARLENQAELKSNVAIAIRDANHQYYSKMLKMSSDSEMFLNDVKIATASSSAILDSLKISNGDFDWLSRLRDAIISGFDARANADELVGPQTDGSKKGEN